MSSGAPRVVGVVTHASVQVELGLCPRPEDQGELGLRNGLEQVSAVGRLGAVAGIGVNVVVVEVHEIKPKASNGAKPWQPLKSCFQ